MENTTSIQQKRVFVKPLISRLEPIQRLKALVSVKWFKTLHVYFIILNMFCPELQNLLRPIYDVTKKDIPFTWKDVHQNVYEEIKKRLFKSPILQLPEEREHFQLYSNTVLLQWEEFFTRFSQTNQNLLHMPISIYLLPHKTIQLCYAVIGAHIDRVKSIHY